MQSSAILKALNAPRRCQAPIPYRPAGYRLQGWIRLTRKHRPFLDKTRIHTMNFHSVDENLAKTEIFMIN